MALLEVRDLHTSFFTDVGEVKAVNGVSFDLERGKVLGIVGESGSGKSVTAYSIMQILAPTGKIVSGSIKLDGQELVNSGEKVMAITQAMYSSSGDYMGAVRYVVSLESADRKIFMSVSLLLLVHKRELQFLHPLPLDVCLERIVSQESLLGAVE